jgi:hypothetical protein
MDESLLDGRCSAEDTGPETMCRVVHLTVPLFISPVEIRRRKVSYLWITRSYRKTWNGSNTTKLARVGRYNTILYSIRKHYPTQKGPFLEVEREVHTPGPHRT